MALRAVLTLWRRADEVPLGMNVALNRRMGIVWHARRMHVMKARQEVVVESISPWTALDSWNKFQVQGPQDRSVYPGDRIVSVNGFMAPALMLQECQTKLLLKMEVMRAGFSHCPCRSWFEAFAGGNVQVCLEYLETLTFCRVEDKGRASAELTYPSFVSCEGPGFAPVWQNFRHLRQEALRVGLSSEALVELQAKASYIIDQWGEQSVEFVTGWHKEFFQLRDSNRVVKTPDCWKNQSCQLPLHTLWLLPLPDSLHGGFCLHGYVAALSCLLHHLKGRITGANAQALTARMQNALGPERSLELLLESSPWNLSSIQLGLEPPPRHLPTIDLTPWAWQPQPAARSTRMPSRVQEAFESFKPASLAFVGHHAGMSLEPAMAMAAVLAELAEEERLQVSFFGQHYACEIIHRCDQDALQEVFRRWMFQPELREDLGRRTATPVVWPELQNAVQQEPQLLQADVWVCTGIWPLCWMLQKISQQPVLHYMVNWIVGEHTPQEWHVSLMTEAARIGAESMAAGEKHHFCTTAWARLSIDISYLVGLKVPHVATLGWHTSLHAGPGLQWRAGPLAARKTAFVPRNVLTRRVQGQLFAAMLGHFNQLPWVQSAGIEVEVWQGGFESINRDAGDPWRGQAHGRIWWSDAVEYMAAVYLAGDITLLTFNELYAMQVPTLVPEIGWQARIMADMCNTGIGWFFKHSPLYNLPEGEENFAFTPWGCDSLDRLRYWLQTADAWRYPHVVHVTSFVDLYQHLLRWANDPTEPQRRSEAMAKFHLDLSIRSLAYFRSLLAAKLPLPVVEAPTSKGVVAALQVSALHTLRRTRASRTRRRTRREQPSELREATTRRKTSGRDKWRSVPRDGWGEVGHPELGHVEALEELATGTISIRGPFDDTVLQILQTTIEQTLKAFCAQRSILIFTEHEVVSSGDNQRFLTLEFQILPPRDGGGDCAWELLKAAEGKDTGPFEDCENCHTKKPIIRRAVLNQLEMYAMTRGTRTDGWYMKMFSIYCRRLEVTMPQGFPSMMQKDYRCEDFFPEATRFPPAADQSTTLPPDNVVTTTRDVAVSDGDICSWMRDPCICATVIVCAWLPDGEGIGRCVKVAAPPSQSQRCESCAALPECPSDPVRECPLALSICACSLLSAGCNWTVEGGLCFAPASGPTGVPCSLCPFASESCPMPRITRISPYFGADMGWNSNYDINLTFDQPVRYPHPTDAVQGEMLLGCRLEDGQFLPPLAPTNRRASFVIQFPASKRVMLSDRVVQLSLGSEEFWSGYECMLNITRGAMVAIQDSVPCLETMKHVVFIRDNVAPSPVQFVPRTSELNVALDLSVATVTLTEPWFLMAQEAELWKLDVNAGPNEYTLVRKLPLQMSESGNLVEQLLIRFGTTPLDPDTVFSIRVPPGALIDRSNNPFAGIEVTDWSFRTAVAVGVVGGEEEEGLSASAITGIVVGALALVGIILLCFCIQRYKIMAQFDRRVKPMEGTSTPKASQVSALQNDSELLPSNEKYWEKALVRTKELPGSSDNVVDALEDLPLTLPGEVKSNRRPSNATGSASISNQRRPSNASAGHPSNQRRPSNAPAGLPTNQRRPSNASADHPSNQRRPSNASAGGRRPSSLVEPSNQRHGSKHSAGGGSRSLGIQPDGRSWEKKFRHHM
ncbi:unnamed protein product [Durusdinium trenchii]|uniref:Uncharacterized protein n=1 Tax=Durusdinium trenchii TaxID=1381693 RepID=A0ABP0SSA8_9DINO